MSLRTTPPRIKLYEALWAVADERIVREKTEDSIISAKVYSSSRGKYYTVTYDPTHHAIMANDNGSYRQGYLGYPSITLLMKIGILPIYKNVLPPLRDIQRKDINQANHNDFEKTITTIDNMLVRQGVDLVAFTQYIDELHVSIDALHLHHLGEKMLPPEGY